MIRSGRIGLVALAGMATLSLASLGSAQQIARVAVPSEREQTPPPPTLQASSSAVGVEVAVERHLADGEEFGVTVAELFELGRILFAANFTDQEGGGRPLTKGTGAPLADPTNPLVGERAFNRLSAPDANSCAGCHNAPFAGGGGDIVANVFVLGHRFDHLTFDHADLTPTRGAVDETGGFVTQQTAANSRATLGMFGAGYIEMLARQITDGLQQIRNRINPGSQRVLRAYGINFGVLVRNLDGTYDASGVVGLPPGSVDTTSGPPSLVVNPFHQAGAVISLRQFTNNAMNHHHGMQSVERFGAGADPDGDGFTDELTVADITATSIYQAGLQPPGRVIPNDPVIEAAVLRGEDLFVSVGCSDCHIPKLPLRRSHQTFTEPNPFNPAGNLKPGDAYTSTHGTYGVDLSNSSLPGPRLPTDPSFGSTVWVYAFTDFKLHDITDGPTDSNVEPLNMHFPGNSAAFHAGNSRFLTKKLWGAANEMPFFHHGRYTTLRQAVEAHAGEASAVMANYNALSPTDQSSIIEFLKTLKVLPANSPSLTVDENGNPKVWRDFPYNWTL